MQDARKPEPGQGPAREATGEPAGSRAGEHWHGFAPAVGRGSEEARRAGHLAFRSPPPGPERPGREPSKQELRGVPPTDVEARSPLGVGVSTSRPGEKISREEGEERPTVGLRGRARRPHGRSRPEEGSRVGRPEPVHGESPFLPPGDQAG